MKILYLTTISNTVNLFLVPHIKMLIEDGHQVDVAFNIEQEVKPEIYEMGCKIHILPFERSPLNIGNLKAYKLLKNLIIREKYDLVHTHTPVASAITRIACKNLDSVKVFYTAHGFHFYKGAPMLNWIVYYPIEKWLSKYTDVLITINKEDFERTKRNFLAKKVEYIPGIGIDLKKYQGAIIDRFAMRNEIGVPQNSYVLLSIGELNNNKNHEVVIRALASIGQLDIHYIICGEGPLEKHLLDLSKKLNVNKRIHLLGFREDIPDICKASDLFMFPSKREGLGLAALEAMATGLPIISSSIHGISDYSKDGITGFTTNPDNISEFAGHIINLYNNKELSEKMGENNRNIVRKYDIENSLNRMEEIYRGAL